MIQSEKMYFSYTDSDVYVLQDINLEINPGEYVSVVGENGSGKSTLMRLMLRLLKPTKGKIENRFQRIGYVPQKKDFTNTNFPITVYEVLESYQRLLKRKQKDLILQSLKQVGMSDFAGSLVGNLSGGQIQKILIARALLGHPELLVLDEPSTGIDQKSQREIYAFLKRMNQEKGLTVISVEHNLDAAISNSTRIYHLKEGRGHICSVQRYAEEYLKLNRGGR